MARNRLTPRPALGLSPIELMIALVLSLALIVSMGQVAVGIQGTSRSETAQSQAQEGGRLSMELLSRELRKTGYRFDRQLSNTAIFPAATPFAAAAVISGDSQSLTMRYLGSGDAWTRSCLGGDVAIGAMMVQRLFVEAGELRCQARNLSTGTDQTQTLMTNVEAMSVTYGIDTDGDAFPDSYQTAGTVSDWRLVASLNIQLRTVSTEQNVNNVAQPYVGFDGTRVMPDDLRIRRYYTGVIALRNRLP